MSVQPSQTSGGGQPADAEGRRFSTLVGSLPATPDDREVPVTRPTFTAGTSGPAVAEPTDTPSADVPAKIATPAPAQPALPDQERTRALPRPAAATIDEPLLSDVAGLRARWQRVQAGFVDDPQEAVGDAADLIEQTAQALVGALRQRQRQLRVMWERSPDPAAEDGAGPSAATDTEHLRLMMQRYRALFNQLCRP